VQPRERDADREGGRRKGGERAHGDALLVRRAVLVAYAAGERDPRGEKPGPKENAARDPAAEVREPVDAGIERVEGIDGDRGPRASALRRRHERRQPSARPGDEHGTGDHEPPDAPRRADAPELRREQRREAPSEPG
jgi:hypothetical protein